MSRILKKITSVILGAMLISQSVGYAAIRREVEYPDISTHWAKSIMLRLNDYGIVGGYADGTMRPDAPVSAAEFITMTVKALNTRFENVSGYWAAPYIDKAIELGLIESGEYVNYNAAVTRAQVAKIAANALSSYEVENENTVKARIYDYAEIPEEYKPYVVVAYDKKIVNGNHENRFEPYRYATRAEVSVIVARLIERNGGIKMPSSGGTNTNAGTNNMPVSSAALYVAANGNDSADGSEAAPFATLKRAKEAVRNMISSGSLPEGGVTVYMRGGTYYIDEGLEFTKADSGRSGSMINYTAYPGEDVIISGQKTISKDWFAPAGEDAKKIIVDKTAKDKVLAVNLKEHGITDYGEMSTRGYHYFNKGRYAQAELVVNDELQTLARYPNSGSITVPADSVDKEAFGFTYTDNRISGWKNAKDAYIVGTISINYENNTYPIEKIDTSKKFLSVKEGRISTYYTNGWFFGENLLEEIDVPGEYYIDRENGILYYYPPADFASSNYDIGLTNLTDPVFKFDGAEYISVSNITLKGGRGYAAVGASAGYKIPTFKEFLVANGIALDGPQFNKASESTVYISNPDNYPDAQVFPGHVWDGFTDKGTGISNVEIKNCNIFNFGSGGIIINGTNIHIDNNHIKNTGGTGLYLRGGDLETLTPSGNTILNNKIHHVGYMQKSYVPAIAMHGVGIYVAHNDIYDSPHCIFNYHGNDHIIEYNKIHEAVKECLDMDAIYTRNEYMPQWRGSVIRNNYIYDIGNYPVGEYTQQLNVSAIRTDNYGHALQIYNNIFANIGSDNANNVIGVTAQGNRNTLKGNMFIDCSATFLGWNTYTPGITWDMTNAEEKERVALAEKYAANPVFAEKYPELATFKNEYYKSVPTNVFDENLVVNIKFKLSQTNGTVNPQSTRGAPDLIKGTNNYVITTDPGFVDYASHNYQLKENSEVFSKIPDFVNPDMSKMGNNAPVGPQK